MSAKTEKSSGRESVMRNAPLRDELAIIAGPREWSDTRESWLARAARNASISFRTAKAIWYGETADPKSSVDARIRAAAQEKREQERRAKRADAARLRSLAAALENIDADFHGLDIARSRALADQLEHMAGDGPLA